MGKIVHTSGSIGRRGVAQGEVCKLCPGGCKTDCLRAGVNIEKTHASNDYFSISFKNIDTTKFKDDEY